ncbi:MAG: potassium transporter TrkG [Gemmobacter sp.]
MRGIRPSLRRLARIPPPVALALIYAAMIVLGTGALMLPFASVRGLGWMEALFTAGSAVTITGLSVIDIAAELTLFGQAVILVLVQVSGLGIMTFAVLILAALGLPMGMTGRIFLRDDLKQVSVARLLDLVRVILRVVLLAEAVCAAALVLVFMPQAGFWPGLWHAVFHAVMAFNNAGFTTLPGGLVPLAAHPLVNVAIPLTVIVGGLGYAVLSDLLTVRHWKRFSLHSKLMLTGTAALLAVSVAGFVALEWSNPATLGGHGSIADRLAVSWFQAVTTRSAGFNTVGIGDIEDGTALMFIALMLIGGGPTSTAGGIKITTFIVVLLATIAFFRRQEQLRAFGRGIGLEQVLKVMALTAISLMLVFLGSFLLVATHQGSFLDVLFEVASALGSNGLSRGLTGELDGFGRAVIIALMFVGRIGPLTLGFFLTTRIAPRVRYPAGQIYLG